VPDRTGKNLTEMLDRWRAGDEGAFARIVEAVQGDVRTLAARKMSRAGLGGAGATIQPTVIADDVLMNLRRQRKPPHNTDHLFALTARGIHRLIADYRRSRRSVKRGAGKRGSAPNKSVAGSTASPAREDPAAQLAYRSLQQLAARSPRQAEIVLLRVYRGLSVPEVAEALQVSEATVNREWREAKEALVDIRARLST
jgi:RNA polymerase sigma factor (TIGR02999 family)